MTTSFLLIVQIVLVVILVIAVLLQKSSSIGLGAYSGSNESVFGAKGPAAFLTKATFLIGFLFVSNTIALGYLYSSNAQASVVDSLVETTKVVAPVKTPTIAPDSPAPIKTPEIAPVETTKVVAPAPVEAPEIAPVAKETNSTSPISSTR